MIPTDRTFNIFEILDIKKGARLHRNKYINKPSNLPLYSAAVDFNFPIKMLKEALCSLKELISNHIFFVLWVLLLSMYQCSLFILSVSFYFKFLYFQSSLVCNLVCKLNLLPFFYHCCPQNSNDVWSFNNCGYA